jgi:hypothetical protein
MRISGRKGACLELLHRAANQSLNNDRTQGAAQVIKILEELGSENVIGRKQFAESASIDR